ncbi:hypothetical protein M9Y10_021669 [Tritrichomonas musculus]|uniref:LNS2/PITP domain-containing protein n=1 Tax=Tritrichomonas musculus TaxID=1915356 RepID=A0ABR2KS74_9EUKA
MIKNIFSKYNPSTLSGALDIIIIEHPDGTLRSSPWHVRFGKLGLLHHVGKVVTVDINNDHAPFLMQVDESGRGQFFSSQSINQFSHSTIIYPKSPSIEFAQVNIQSKDVRHILSKLKEKKRNEPNIKDNFNMINISSDDDLTNANDYESFFPYDEDLKYQMIHDDDAVDLEAALKYKDPDPQPISTISSSLDLAQSTNTIGHHHQTLDSTNNELTDITNTKVRPVPSALLLSSMRSMLHYGKNDVVFTVSSLIQGPKKIEANIFLWKSSVKLIVSDVDGTVTSSDLLGHVLPTFGKDWTHPGLAPLYNKIEKNGKNTQFVYLSSRPIGEASLTRKMLKKIQQDGFVMPEGPLITAPDLAIPAMAREMQRKPHEFKIPTLMQIKDLFAKPSGSLKSESTENLALESIAFASELDDHHNSAADPDFNSNVDLDNNQINPQSEINNMNDENDGMPFIFGFGNRKTDVISYRNVGLRDDQILLFDTKHRVLDAKQEILYKSIENLTNDIQKFNIGKVSHLHED